MAKRVFIIHGWGGNPNEGWLPWLKRELEVRGFLVSVPEMPDADEPRVETWVPYLTSQVGTPDEDTYFVGHSIGCLTILKYLERMAAPVGGAVFVAGWFSLTPEATPTPAEQEIARQWLAQPIDFGKVRRTTKNFTAIFSDDDPDVPIENTKLFHDRIGAEVLIQSGKGHFGGSDGVRELPAARDAIARYAESH